MELALFSVRWIQEFLMVRWLENGKKLSMKDVEEISWRYAREVEHSDDNLNALEDWLFDRFNHRKKHIAKMNHTNKKALFYKIERTVSPDVNE